MITSYGIKFKKNKDFKKRVTRQLNFPNATTDYFFGHMEIIKRSENGSETLFSSFDYKVKPRIKVVIYRGHSPCPYHTGWSNLATLSKNGRCTCCEEKKTMVITNPGLTSISISDDELISYFYFQSSLFYFVIRNEES